MKYVSEAGGEREEVCKWDRGRDERGEVCKWDRVRVCRVVCETVSHVCHLSGVSGAEDRRDGCW